MYHIYAQINSNSYYKEDISLFYHKADKRVVNINLKVVKHNKATVGLLTVSKMSQNKIMLKTLNGNISSPMYASTSLFISALVTCCWKSSRGGLAGVGNNGNDNLLSASVSLRVYSYSLELACCRWRCFDRLEVVFTAVEVFLTWAQCSYIVQSRLCPFAQLIRSNVHTSIP